MRLSSSLLLILAAITMANAAVVESAIHPKHKLVRVKNGNAKINAIDAAKVKVRPDLKNLKYLVSVAAKRGLDVSAINNSANANVAAVDLKQVSSIVHSLSSMLESQNKMADSVLKIKDQKLAAVQTEKLLDNVKASLASAVVDIHQLSSSTTSTSGSLANVKLLRRDVLQALDLNTVTSLISGANTAGAGNLVSLLSGINTDSVLQGDVLSILSSVDVMKTVHEVANVDTVLTSVVSVPAAVPLVEALQELDSPISFVTALTDIKSISSLVAAAPGGLDSIAKVDGAQKLVAYAGKYGFDTVARVFAVGGVENVLTSLVAVPGSVKLLDSIKTVADVPAFVSGLHVLNVPSFVSSVQAVDNIEALTSVMSLAKGVAPVRRAELLQGVQSTVAGLDVTKVLNLKRALAHIAALPDSDLVSIEENAKRAILNSLDLDAVLGDLDVAKIGLIKRSIVDLSMLSEKEIDALRGAMKRDVLSGLPVGGIVSDLPVGGVLATAEGAVGGLNVLKRDVLSGLPLKNVAGTDGILGTVRGTVGPATKQLPMHLDSVEKIKREVLSTLSGSGSGDLLGQGGAALNVLDLAGGPVADIGGAGDGLLGSGGGDLSFLDLNRILAVVKRSDLLAPVQGTISNLDLAKILPALKREIVDADAATASAPGLTSPVEDAGHIVSSVEGQAYDQYSDLTHHQRRRSTTKEAAVADTTISITLLEDAIDTLTVDVAAMLTKVVSITDAIHVDAITTDVKTEVVPLVSAVAKTLDSIVSVKAPKLTTKVEKVSGMAQKTASSLA